MMKLKNLFHRHEWAYKTGNSIGQLAGVRDTCLIRECIICHKREEIAMFDNIYTSPIDGMRFMSEPNWEDYDFSEDVLRD